MTCYAAINIADRARLPNPAEQDHAKVYGEMLATCAACHTTKGTP